jgi:hypothetical protein
LCLTAAREGAPAKPGEPRLLQVAQHRWPLLLLLLLLLLLSPGHQHTLWVLQVTLREHQLHHLLLLLLPVATTPADKHHLLLLLLRCRRQG